MKEMGLSGPRAAITSHTGSSSDHTSSGAGYWAGGAAAAGTTGSSSVAVGSGWPEKPTPLVITSPGRDSVTGRSTAASTIQLSPTPSGKVRASMHDATRSIQHAQSTLCALTT